MRMSRQMQKVYALTILSLLALCLAPAQTLAQGQGVIEGQVVNGTANGGPVEGLMVTLHVFAGMEEETPQTTTTDAKGRFRFEGLSTEANHVYALLLNYQGADYGSDLLAFSEGETALSVPIQVYESTESDEAVSIEQAHIFVDFREISLVVGEMYIFSNSSDRTCIGEEVAEGRRETLRLSLPTGAEELAFESGELGQRFFETAEGFVDTWPLGGLCGHLAPVARPGFRTFAV